MEKKIDSKLLFDGKLLKLYKDDVELDDKSTTIREYVKHPGGVCILGIIDGKVVMEKQFRYPYHKEILELPAGKLEPGEDPKTAAIREFEEETGYLARKITPMGELYPTVAYTDEIIRLFYVEDLVKTERHLDIDERIDVVYLPIEEVKEKILNYEIKDAKTVALILKYLLLK